MHRYTCPDCGKNNKRHRKNALCFDCLQKHKLSYLKKYQQTESYKKALAKSRVKNHDKILAREKARYMSAKIQIERKEKALFSYWQKVLELSDKIAELRKDQNGE